MYRVLLGLLGVVLATSQMGGCVPIADEVPEVYKIQTTLAGSFAPFGGGTDPPAPVFGPSVGYPKPAAVAREDFGAVERGDFVQFESSKGDLTKMVARIVDADGNTVATPDLDPDSIPSFIGIKIPSTLVAGAYRLQFRTPTDILVAEVKFQIRNMIFDRGFPKP